MQIFLERGKSEFHFVRHDRQTEGKCCESKKGMEKEGKDKESEKDRRKKADWKVVGVESDWAWLVDCVIAHRFSCIMNRTRG